MKKSGKLAAVLALLIMFISIKAFFSCIPGNPSEEEYKTNISGTLSLSAGGAPVLENEPVSRPANAPLVGYKLYCLTLTEPVKEGSGVSDASGNVTVVLKVKNPTFGCNIQDAAGKGIASLFFSDSSGNKGQTVTGSGDINLGMVVVSESEGLAQATLPSNATVVTSTPPGVPCPVGTWLAGPFPSDCGGGKTTTESLWVSKTASGQYLTSISLDNIYRYSNSTCVTLGQSNVPVSYSGGVLSADFHLIPECPETFLNLSLTIDQACTTATVDSNYHGCVDCLGAGGSCRGCGGTVTCTRSYTITRQ